MAVNTPLSPGGKNELRLPMPPPLLHTRSGNEFFERPHTPTKNGFTTPVQTPQGSPSKNRMPPGANDLPNVFENAMRLVPSSPTKQSRQQQMPLSPTKNGIATNEDTVMGGDESMLRKDQTAIPGSPTRKSNKENTPPGGRFAKDMSHTPNQAAVSRQEPYQQREQKTVAPLRGLTPEELEKLQLPKVKRLANVTQLCKCTWLVSHWAY
jgi:cell cycle protein kinase DBF2